MPFICSHGTQAPSHNKGHSKPRTTEVNIEGIKMKLITIYLILLLKTTLILGEMFIKEAMYYKIENGEKIAGKPWHTGKVNTESYCMMECVGVDSCVGVSHEDKHCTMIITFTYPPEGVVHTASSTNAIYRKDRGPPEMYISFEDLSQITLNGAENTTGYRGQGLDFPNSGSTGQTADVGILKGKACFVTPQSCNNGFTLSLWAKIRSSNPGHDSGFLTSFDINKQGINIRRSYGKLYFLMRLASGEADKAVDYSGHWDTWTHIALSMAKPGSDLNIYYNGMFQDSGPFHNTGSYPPNAGRLVFGRLEVDGNNYYGSAILDEVCSWNIMLSDSEILRVYQN